MASLTDHSVVLPTGKIPEDTDATAVASSFTEYFRSELSPDLFAKDALWRDTFALTGTLRTFYSAASISAAWNEVAKVVKPGSLTLHPKSARVLPIGEATWLQAMFSFETMGSPKTECTAILALIPNEKGGWCIWCLRTILDQLKGQQNVDTLEVSNPNGKLNEYTNGYINGYTNGDSNHVNGHTDKPTFQCVVIGGGQAGLSAGGRLKALGINYVILDKQNEVGDSWKSRYKSARLHTTREYAHLPFDRTFPATYQEWLTKDDLAQGYRDWVSKFGIKIWQKTSVTSGSWNASQKHWQLNIQREGKESSITTSYVILAGGGSQISTMPEYPNRESFRGKILHSSMYEDANLWKGKRGVVIGTANTAHDVAVDMLEAGLAEVTMVQRSKTYVLPVEYYKRVADMSYNSTVPTDLADKYGLSQPWTVIDLLSNNHLHSEARKEPARFAALERAGFRVDHFGSVTHHLYNRSGGHYMDVGGSEKIAKGLIKIKSNSLPISYSPTGLNFSDGSVLPADVIIFATGFNADQKFLAKQIFGTEIAEQMGEFWGFDKEGEIRGAFVPLDHPAIWYHGGTQGQARYFSRFIALQIKAALMGTPLPVYQKTP